MTRFGVAAKVERSASALVLGMISLLAALPAYTPPSVATTPALALEVQAEAVTLVAGGMLSGVAAADAPMPSDHCSTAIAIGKDRRLVSVALGYDRQYWASWQSASGFLPWKSLSGSAFASGPAVVQDAQGDVAVFGRVAGGRLQYATLHPSGGGGDWIDLGGATTGRPAPIMDSRGLLHVFAQSATDHAVLYKGQYINGSRAVWASWQVLDGHVSSAPQPLLDAEGWIHVLARGLDRSLWHKQQVAASSASSGWEWGEWMSIGVGLPLPSMPRIPRTLNSQNFLELFTRGPDRALWHKRQALASDESSVGWSAWRRLGGVLAGAPAASVGSDGLISVFVRGVDGAVWMTQQAHHPVAAGADAWVSWSRLQGAQIHASAPEVATDGNGLMHLFSRSTDGAMLHLRQAAVLGGNASSTDFPTAWASLGGRFRSFQC